MRHRAHSAQWLRSWSLLYSCSLLQQKWQVLPSRLVWYNVPMEEQQPTAPPRERKQRARAQGKRQRLTQQAIVDGAAKLFAERGFGATSLDEIADSLGAGKASLYYHVKNKEEILRLIFLTVLTASEDPLRRIAEAVLPPRD